MRYSFLVATCLLAVTPSLIFCKKVPLVKSASVSVPVRELRVLPLGKSVQASSSDLPNSDQMQSVHAVYYIGPVEVNGQTFQVIYDTGSNLLWVPSSDCGSTCSGRSEYSGRSADTGQNFNVRYGSGDVTGDLVHAPVTLADASLSSFKMGLANDVQFQDFQSSEFDGILGLAWPSLSASEDVPSLVPSLYGAGQIPQNLFTIYLAPDGSGGELSLGEIDETRYHGELSWLPLIAEQWWTVNLDGVQVDSVPALSRSQVAILDSGTSLIVGPQTQVSALVGSIQARAGVPVYYDSNSQVYSIHCSDVKSLPNLTFALSGADNQQYLYTMPGPSYVLKALSSDRSACPLALQGSNGLGHVDWILGDPFLRTFYSVYDYQGSRVGLAAADPSTGSVLPGTSGVGPKSTIVLPVVCLIVIAFVY